MGSRQCTPALVPVDARVLVQKESWKGRGGAWRSAPSPRAPLRHDHMAPSYATGAPCLFCGVVGSGLNNRELPLHGVRAQRCGHLVLFRTKSRPRPRCGSPVPDMSRNKRGYLQDLPTRATTAFKDKGAAKKGVYVACVLVFVMHACLCLCRLLQRGQHDDACVLVLGPALAATPTCRTWRRRRQRSRRRCERAWASSRSTRSLKGRS